MNEAKRVCNTMENPVTAKINELFAEGKKPIEVRDTIREWATMNDVQLPEDWDYPIREKLCDKHGKLSREEINFLLQMPKKVKYRSKDDVKRKREALQRSQQADWTIRLREIHCLAQYNRDVEANGRLLDMAKHEKSKHCRDIAVRYVNLRKLAGKKGLPFPPAYRHLKRLREMKIINQKLLKIGRAISNQSGQPIPSIRWIVNKFRHDEPALYYLIDSYMYNPKIEDATECWFRNKCKSLGVSYAEMETQDSVTASEDSILSA